MSYGLDCFSASRILEGLEWEMSQSAHYYEPLAKPASALLSVSFTVSCLTNTALLFSP